MKELHTEEDVAMLWPMGIGPQAWIGEWRSGGDHVVGLDPVLILPVVLVWCWCEDEDECC